MNLKQHLKVHYVKISVLYFYEDSFQRCIVSKWVLYLNENTVQVHDEKDRKQGSWVKCGLPWGWLAPLGPHIDLTNFATGEVVLYHILQVVDTFLYSFIKAWGGPAKNLMSVSQKSYKKRTDGWVQDCSIQCISNG